MTKDFHGDESAFRHLLSGFPSSCLVVPFFDSDSSNFICRSVGLDGTGFGKGVLVHRGKVVWHKYLSFFQSYGVDAFPFTDQVIENIRHEQENESWNSRSLCNLFCCPPSTVLRKNTKSDETISISELQEKPAVGVYLCFNGDLIPTLHHIHECCKDARKTFEIVVVYFPFSTQNPDPRVFENHINRALEKRNISWWVLPFKRWVSLRLQRLCMDHSDVDELIIVGKGFADPFCAYVVRKFGLRAYPFSKELMFQEEANRISNLTLASMLVHGKRDYVLRNRLDKVQVSVQVPVASLVGKNVLVYICKTVERIKAFSVCGPLLKYYSAMKAKDPDTELVYIGPCPSLISITTEMPWLICPYDVSHLDSLSKVIFSFSESSNYLNNLVAFKKDGLLGSIQVSKHLSSRGVEAYPFDNSRLKEEVIDEFKDRFPRFEALN
ncbi:putative nucleoredoxin 1 [Silene latifolia]|uniref:putative nucleoredoxin 1 n=1 Tax=Silene latifolia TaxID=37657 RepID=UPI003D7725C3